MTMTMHPDADPRPLRYLLTVERVPQHRNLACAAYDACLDKMQGATSFTCASCPHRLDQPVSDALDVAAFTRKNIGVTDRGA